MYSVQLSPSLSSRVLSLTNADTSEDVVNFAKCFISARVLDVEYVKNRNLELMTKFCHSLILLLSLLMDIISVTNE